MSLSILETVRKCQNKSKEEKRKNRKERNCDFVLGESKAFAAFVYGKKELLAEHLV